MSFEQIMCPKHGTPMNKGNQNGVTIDACRSGCVFLDAGELATLMSLAANGQSLRYHGRQHGHAAHHGRHHGGSGSFDVFGPGSGGFFSFGGGSGS